MLFSLLALVCDLVASYATAAPAVVCGNACVRGPLKTTLPLRVLPLGDSITWGYLSSDGNGYRLDLLNLLNANGTEVEYIGSQTSGNMTNNHNEGHPGALIAEIAQYAYASLPQQPNIILLMAGTNDMNTNNKATNGPDRLGSLIDECHNATFSAAGNSVIIVAQLTPSSNNDIEARIETFNAAIPVLVEDKAQKGVKVLTVNMSAYVTAGDLQDDLHPTDYGYGLMAEAWYAGIDEAFEKGWITSAVKILAP